jgi:hypothetical protein
MGAMAPHDDGEKRSEDSEAHGEESEREREGRGATVTLQASLQAATSSPCATPTR